MRLLIVLRVLIQSKTVESLMSLDAHLFMFYNLWFKRFEDVDSRLVDLLCIAHLPEGTKSYHFLLSVTCMLSTYNSALSAQSITHSLTHSLARSQSIALWVVCCAASVAGASTCTCAWTNANNHAHMDACTFDYNACQRKMNCCR